MAETPPIFQNGLMLYDKEQAIELKSLYDLKSYPDLISIE